MTRVGVVDTAGREGAHRDTPGVLASLGRSAPPGVAMAGDGEVQPLLTRAARDAAGRADESTSGSVSRRAKGACARLIASPGRVARVPRVHMHRMGSIARGDHDPESLLDPRFTRTDSPNPPATLTSDPLTRETRLNTSQHAHAGALVSALALLAVGALAAVARPASARLGACLLYTSPSPRDATLSRMPSSA